MKLLRSQPFFIAVLSAFILNACNNSEGDAASKETVKDTPVNETAVIKKTDAVTKTCYVHAQANDTAAISFTRDGKSVTGDLFYKLKEKDRNTGTIKGTIENDLLIAYYTFQSEGMTSVREEVFKMQGDELVSGFGEIVMKNDTAAFADRSKLDFKNGIRFHKTDCAK